MNTANLISLATVKILEKKIKEFDAKEPLAGPRGPRGLSFDWDTHKEDVLSLIQDNFDLFDSLTEEQRLSLKGSDGAIGEKGDRGERGVEGRDGVDFIWADHAEEIESILKQAEIKFESLTQTQVELLRGEKGDSGRDGADFSWDASKDEVASLVTNYISEIKDTLRLKFSELSEDEIESLRGPSGKNGKEGKSFEFEEHSDEIANIINSAVEFIKPELKLKFSDLSEEDRCSLKLKFEELTPEDILTIRGPRGQRGKSGSQGIQGEQGDQGVQGIQGEKGDLGPRGARGAIGAKGEKGEKGEQGYDGVSAPVITDIDLLETGNKFYLKFTFSDGSEIETSPIEKPDGDTISYFPWGVSGGGNGGSGGGGDGQSAYQLAVKNGFIGTEEEWLESLKLSGGSTDIHISKDGVAILDATSIDFVGMNVEVAAIGSVAEWEALSDIEKLSQPSLNPKTARVTISAPPTILNNPLPDTDGSWRFIVTDSGSLAIEKRVGGIWVTKDIIS